MKNLTITCLAVIVLFATTQCASIVSKNKYPVTFRSEPEEVMVSIVDRKGNIVFTGTTPAHSSLKSSAGFFKRAKYTVTYKKEGYDDLIFPLEADIDGWYFGNFLLGGFIGFLIVDPATGAMYKIGHRSINMALKSQASASNAPETLNIRDISDIPEDMKPYLERIN